MPQVNLTTDVQYLKGIGPRLAEGLYKAGLKTVDDLLFKFPRRYEDRSRLPAISSVIVGEAVTVHGKIKRIDSKPLRGGKVILRAYLSDGTGTICMTWFNQPWIKGQLEKAHGDVYAYGQVKLGNNNVIELASPEWEAVAEDDDPNEFKKIVPVYGLTEGLSQKTVRKAIRFAVAHCLQEVPDPLPMAFRKTHRLPDIQWALRQLHEPENEEFRLQAKERMVFEEFFYLQLGLAMKRAETHHEIGIAFPVAQLLGTEDVGAALNKLIPTLPDVSDPFDSTPGNLFAREARKSWDSESLPTQIRRILPFTLTGAQQRVLDEIWRDMASPHPMNRMVQGDVGSGKTAVAACALLTAVRSGYQAAIMAPTEILADQHYVNLRHLLEPIGVKVTQLVGKQGQRERKSAVWEVSEGAADIVVGTHALIQDEIKFKELGLVIVDEQHRFGVLQRKALRDKSHTNPDVLVMTATPIPRTLTMTYYGDLDLSIIDELPPGRLPIKTHWKRPSDRDAIYASARKLIEEGRQAYFVCPLVSETEKMMAQAAEDLHFRLLHGPLIGLNVGLLHGQMKSKEKENVIEQFRAASLQALVSTTVVEVGVDVPNATLMVIEDANRFGLSQLHQLRGRVGRGSRQSYCVLIADSTGEGVRDRMEVLVKNSDGFKIADEDLRLRGPGMLAGTAQSGRGEFHLGDLRTDGRLLEVARQAAIAVIDKDPQMNALQWQLALKKVKQARDQNAIITVS